ncbi:cryptochrome/deoxyribodipyrimidine photo-lyase family protein [Paludibacterium paludis]|nr:FAD-binding domain-containing protein [Paludibacterium paludis]
MSAGLQVVWFKRDLRLHDHAALCHAAAAGPVLCLYLIEPSLWSEPDAACQHYLFARECLDDLQRSLAARGGGVLLLCGEAVTMLERLHRVAPFAALWSHQETGNAASFARDRAVAAWCRAKGIPWHQPRQFGVVRALPCRDGWERQWRALMEEPVLPAPACRFATVPVTSDPWPTPSSLGLDDWNPPLRQTGGRRAGIAALDSFLHERSRHYRGGISSPLLAEEACSRLSPYLSHGCLSLREVYQATCRRLVLLGPEAQWQKQGLRAFLSRLHWHCHFIQKLETEPELEWRNLHRGYDGLREHEWDEARFTALREGRTGWPLVDACVAMLHASGWLNFRMRAMLVSVAAYPLWLHWRPVGIWLAREFLDYEPGIHWSQLQMQSGTTGINVTRVYNPLKQGRDQDPEGRFVRRWLPPLRRVPDTWLFEPWRMPDDVQRRCGVIVGVDIPRPIVDLQLATRQAKARVHALRREADVRAGKAAIIEKHGSRKGTPGKSRAGAERNLTQLRLDW